jgi:hypothetical protein
MISFVPTEMIDPVPQLQHHPFTDQPFQEGILKSKRAIAFMQYYR